MQSSKEKQGEIREPSSVNNSKKQRKATEWERLEIYPRKLEIAFHSPLSLSSRGYSRNVQGNISCKDGYMKGQKHYRPNKAEDIKKRWQERTCTEEMYIKDLNDPDNHDGVITHLEPDILECEVKWALGNITTNKAGRGDGIPAELFQILKDDAVKMLHSVSICYTMSANLENSAVATGLGKVSFYSNPKKRGMPENIQTTAQLHSFHTLAK